jgi:hypothetical protein
VRPYNPEEIRAQELARKRELRYGPGVVDPGNYWRLLEANAGTRREMAFRRWRESGYRDTAAHDEFIAMFCAANEAGMQARRVGA